MERRHLWEARKEGRWAWEGLVISLLASAAGECSHARLAESVSIHTSPGAGGMLSHLVWEVFKFSL